MSYFATGIRAALTQRLRSIRGWLVLLLLPLLIFTVKTCLPAEEAAAPVQVGVALPEEGAEDLWELLDSRSGAVLRFVRTDEKTIDRNVAAGRWDCGLIAAEDFARRLEEMDTDRIFTVRISSGSTVYPLVQETVSASMAYLLSARIAEDYLADTGIPMTEEAREILRRHLEEPMQESDCVVVSLKTYDGTRLDALTLVDSGTDALLRWLTAAVLLVWMLLCGADLGKWFHSPGVRRMYPLRSATELLLARVSADVIIGALAGSAALLVLGDGPAGCAAAAGYACFWGGVSILAARFPAVWSSLPVLPSFAVVLSLLFSSVLVDIGLIIPVLDKAADFAPVSVFLRICGGSLREIPLGLAAAAACTGLSFLMDIRRRKG